MRHLQVLYLVVNGKRKMVIESSPGIFCANKTWLFSFVTVGGFLFVLLTAFSNTHHFKRHFFCSTKVRSWYDLRSKLNYTKRQKRRLYTYFSSWFVCSIYFVCKPPEICEWYFLNARFSCFNMIVCSSKCGNLPQDNASHTARQIREMIIICIYN